MYKPWVSDLVMFLCSSFSYEKFKLQFSENFHLSSCLRLKYISSITAKTVPYISYEQILSFNAHALHTISEKHQYDKEYEGRRAIGKKCPKTKVPLGS